MLENANAFTPSLSGHPSVDPHCSPDKVQTPKQDSVTPESRMQLVSTNNGVSYSNGAHGLNAYPMLRAVLNPPDVFPPLFTPNYSSAEWTALLFPFYR